MSQETLVLQAIAAFGPELLKEIKNLGKDGYNKISSSFELNVKKYLDKRQDRVSKVKTLIHSNDPVSFYQIYEPLKARLLGHSTFVYEAEDLFKIHSLFTVFGPAGCGKTTFLKHIANSCINSKIALPVTILLRNIETDNFNFMDLIVEDTFNSIPLNEIEVLMARGRLAIFLDGYDEAKDKIRSKILREIKRLTKEFPEIKIILSTRPGNNLKYLEGFHNVEIESFDKAQSLSFVGKQLFKREHTNKKKIIELVDSGFFKKEVRDYLTNPLLLNIFIVTMDHKLEVPENIQEFYSRVLDALFYKHDQDTKPSFNREFRTNLTNTQLLVFLQKFSFVSHLSSRYSFTTNVVDETSRQIGLGYGSTFEKQDLIYDLESSLCLWTENDSRYQFSHRSLQEFLACQHVMSLGSNSKKDFYKNIFSEKYFSSEMSNYKWSHDFLLSSDVYDFVLFFELYNLSEACKFLDMFTGKDLTQKNLLSHLIVDFDEVEINFSLQFYRLAKYCSGELYNYLFEISDVFHAAEMIKNMNLPNFGRPTKERLIFYLAAELESYEIELEIRKAGISLARIVEEKKELIKNLKRSEKDLFKYIKR